MDKIEKYMEELSDVFTKEELILLKDIAFPKIEAHPDLAEDIVQVCLEVLLQTKNCSTKVIIEKANERIKEEISTSGVSMDSIEQHKDDKDLICEMDDYLEESLAERVLKEELESIEFGKDIEGERKSAQNKRMVYQYVIEERDMNQLADEYGLAESTASLVVTAITKYIGMKYYFAYFKRYPEKYIQIKDDIWRYCCQQGDSLTREEVQNIKYITALSFSQIFFSKFQQTYQNIKEVEYKVYQKSHTRIG